MNYKARLAEAGFENYKLLEIFDGGNSNVLKVSKGARLLAVKVYHGDSRRIDRMIKHEEAAYSALARMPLTSIPQNRKFYPDQGISVYDWIEGSHPIPDSHCMRAIISFCSTLYMNRMMSVENAVDAAFSTRELVGQIKARLLLLNRSEQFETIETINRIRTTLLILDSNVTEFKSKTISVSDLGVHNIIQSNNDYFFIDFEFFGNDSITKMVADFWLHPKNYFNISEMLRFQKSLESSSDWDATELQSAIPLVALKWATITLGRFSRSFGNNDFPTEESSRLLATTNSYIGFSRMNIGNQNLLLTETFANYLLERK
jgi:hypothetical protein